MSAEKEHGLNRYKPINIITTDAPLALVRKIKQVPEDYERYKFYLSEMDKDPALHFNMIECSRIAAMLMQLEGYDAWAYDISIEELAMFETTNERLRKINEYVLNYLDKSKKKGLIEDSLSNAKELLLQLKGDDGDVQLKWKKPLAAVDIDYEEVEENDK